VLVGEGALVRKDQRNLATTQSWIRSIRALQGFEQRRESWLRSRGYAVRLSADEREQLEAPIRKGKNPAQRLRGAGCGDPSTCFCQKKGRRFIAGGLFVFAGNLLRPLRFSDVFDEHEVRRDRDHQQTHSERNSFNQHFRSFPSLIRLRDAL
jgi:hypothetical protein